MFSSSLNYLQVLHIWTLFLRDICWHNPTTVKITSSVIISAQNFKHYWQWYNYAVGAHWQENE